jgi:integrase/recombinase XerD
MSDKNRKLTDFAREQDEVESEDQRDENRCETDGKKESRQLTDRDSDVICDRYTEIKREYENRLNEIGISPVECGHCVEYICNELTAGTARTYNSALRLFLNFIHQDDVCIYNVEFIHVRDYFEFRGKQDLSKSTVARDRSAIVGVISRYEAENRDVPALTLKIKQNIDPSQYGHGKTFEREKLSDEELHALLEALDDFRNKLLVLTAIELGPRNEAITLIKIIDVNLENKTILLKNTKYDREYEMPLTDNLYSLYYHWINDVRSSYINGSDEGYLFPSREGNKLSTGQLRTIVDDAAKRAGIQKEIAKIPNSGSQKEASSNDYRSKKRVDVHVLRHTFSWLMKESGVSKEARKHAMDHVLDVTDRYGSDKEACIKEIREKFSGVDSEML